MAPERRPFSGWQLLRASLRDAARATFAAFAAVGADRRVLYGELFGGGDPHPDGPTGGVIPVQTGVWCAPDLRWALFALRAVDEGEDAFLAFSEAAAVAAAAGLMMPPLLARRRKAEVTALPERFPPTLVRWGERLANGPRLASGEGGDRGAACRSDERCRAQPTLSPRKDRLGPVGSLHGRAAANPWTRAALADTDTPTRDGGRSVGWNAGLLCRVAAVPVPAIGIGEAEVETARDAVRNTARAIRGADQVAVAMVRGAGAPGPARQAISLQVAERGALRIIGARVSDPLPLRTAAAGGVAAAA
ncbi:hypothetical protein WMF28_31135 [Sorangium sp. So ce590]|uniref:hypothetical protein n=1 Tax=Sorangium sp. So ce590 TaxID=3133317 RepID=UPI003F5DB15B